MKRFFTGTGITLVALSGAVALWYQSHYSMPPEQKRQMALPSPNGFDTLQAATKLEVRNKNGIAVRSEYRNSPPSRYYPPQPLAGRLQLLAANQPAIEKMREGLRQEYLFPAAEPVHLSYPKSYQHRSLAWLLNFASQTYADSGNLPEAVRCTLDGVELGVTTPRGAALSPALIGLSCESMGVRATWALLDSIDAKTAREAALRLEALDARRWPLIKNFEEEVHSATRFYVLPVFHNGNLKKTWDDSDIEFDSKDTEAPASLSDSQKLWLRAKIVYYGPKTVLDSSEQWIKGVRARAELPWGSERPALPEPVDPISKMVLPSTFYPEFKELGIRTQTRLLIVSLALRAYRLEKGSYPPALDTLVETGYLKAVPIDPFSPTRAPLCYAPGGKLWSVGPDARDNSGAPIEMNGNRGYVTEGKTGDIVARVNTW